MFHQNIPFSTNHEHSITRVFFSKVIDGELDRKNQSQYHWYDMKKKHKIQTK